MIFYGLYGEAIFHFLPVGITWSVVRKMGGSQILGIILGITLVSPQLMNAYNIGKATPDFWDFGLFTIDKIGYQAQVIPSIFAGFVLAFIETKLNKVIHESIRIVCPNYCISCYSFLSSCCYWSYWKRNWRFNRSFLPNNSYRKICSFRFYCFSILICSSCYYRSSSYYKCNRIYFSSESEEQ